MSGRDDVPGLVDVPGLEEFPGLVEFPGLEELPGRFVTPGLVGALCGRVELLGRKRTEPKSERRYEWNTLSSLTRCGAE